MTEEGDQGRGFTVSDRRRFSPETGDVRDDVENPKEDDVRRGPAARGPSGAAAGPDAGTAGSSARAGLPEITLTMFVMSLSTQVLMHLGEIPNPVDNSVQRDMSAAKQVIDILGMLKEKTKGNLDGNEESLFENVLYDLRMRFVELSKPGAGQ
jgi:hypothetical protein